MLSGHGNPVMGQPPASFQPVKKPHHSGSLLSDEMWSVGGVVQSPRDRRLVAPTAAQLRATRATAPLPLSGRCAVRSSREHHRPPAPHDTSQAFIGTLTTLPTPPRYHNW